MSCSICLTDGKQHNLPSRSPRSNLDSTFLPRQQGRPIFNKKALSYDKYELAKVISYEQLELLFRPFKNRPSFKDFVHWWQIFIILKATYFLLLIVICYTNSEINLLVCLVCLYVGLVILYGFA